MGIGVKAFEERFARQLSVVRDLPDRAGIVDGTFVSDLYGIAFSVPNGWTRPDREEVERASEGRVLNREYEVLSDVYRLMGAFRPPPIMIAPPVLDDPVARIGPYEIAPVASFTLEYTLSEQEPATFDLMEYVAQNIEGAAFRMQDFRVTEEPERMVISNCEAAGFWGEYTLLHMDAVAGHPTREHACYVRQGRIIWALQMCDYPEVDPRLAVDFTDFLESVRVR